MSDDRFLIAAYLDGVTELAPDERRRVEALLAADADAAAEADATRTMLDQLRALPDAAELASPPDSRALAVAIAKALPAPRAPRRRAPIYLGVAALAATLVAYVATRDGASPTPTNTAALASLAPALTSSHVWLGDDNDSLDLDLDASGTVQAIDALAPDDDYISWEPDPFGGQFGARIDAVDDAAMERIEHWLEKG